MELDLHIHSNYSFDSNSRIKDILKIAKKRDLGGIAITDHNTIKGSLQALKMSDGPVVIGASEIGTEIGDIIALFINEEIKSRISIEVIDEIRNQGGIAVLAHPFKRKKNFDSGTMKIFDAIEIFNARAAKTNKDAKKCAEYYDLPMTAGSDSHFCFEIGRGRTVVQDAYDLESIRKSILKKQVEVKGIESGFYLDIFSQSIRLFKQKRMRQTIQKKILKYFN